MDLQQGLKLVDHHQLDPQQDLKLVDQPEPQQGLKLVEMPHLWYQQDHKLLELQPNKFLKAQYKIHNHQLVKLSHKMEQQLDHLQYQEHYREVLHLNSFQEH